jgi:two-component system nitrate/nitrite response regulator NarL
MNKIKLAITDDHQIVIDGLIAMMQNFPELEVVTTANNGKEMLEQLKQQKVDVLLTDLMMPVMDGCSLAATVKKDFPNIGIIALSMSANVFSAGDLIRNKIISGYLLKQTNINELQQAIHIVANGGTFFQDQVMRSVKQEEQIRKKSEQTGLTLREKEIIALLEKDLSNKQIASSLNISIRTVETHRKNILLKTGCNNILSLMKWAYQHKIVEPPQ